MRNVFINFIRSLNEEESIDLARQIVGLVNDYCGTNELGTQEISPEIRKLYARLNKELTETGLLEE